MTDQGNVKFIGNVQARGIYIGNTQSANYGGGYVVIPDEPEIPVDTTLGVWPYNIGYAMDWDKSARTGYLDAFKTGDLVTPENASTTQHINPSAKITLDTLAKIADPSNYNWNFTELDNIIAWSQANNKVIHFAHVIWNNNNTAVGATRTKKQAPHVELFTTQAQLEAYVLMYATYVAQHCVGKLNRYNVINEMVNDFNDATTGGLNKTNNKWTELSTTERLSDIIISAIYAVDPTAQCGFNDYNLETGNMTRTNRYIAIHNYLLGLNKTVNGRRVKFDFVGFQTHTALGLDLKIAGQRFKIWSDLGVKVFISEFDTTTTKPYDTALAERVAKFYVDVVKTYETNVTPAMRFGFCMWEASERDFEKNGGLGAPNSTNPIIHFPALFDYYYVRKLVFYRMKDYNLNRA